MKLKLDENGHVVVQEGRPVYVHDDGKEIAFDAPATVAKIGQLNSEAKGHRERAETAEAKLKTFGDLDPEAARSALDVVKNLDDKKLIDAGQVEQMRTEAIRATEEKYRPYVKKAETLENQLTAEKIGGAFARSKYITDKLAIPADMVQSRFAQHFKVEDGKVVAYDATGNKLFSRVKLGDLADFEEAIEMVVDAYPYKDHILKGSGASGSGARGSAAVTGAGKTISRAQFDAMAPAERSAAMKAGTRLTD
jgi:hypothetical protein